MGRRDAERSADESAENRSEQPLNNAVPGPEADGSCGNDVACGGAEMAGKLETEMEAAASISTPAAYHNGLARKVLPDVVGLLNSRLWSLWGPNI